MDLVHDLDPGTATPLMWCSTETKSTAATLCNNATMEWHCHRKNCASAHLQTDHLGAGGVSPCAKGRVGQGDLLYEAARTAHNDLLLIRI